jgi:MoxR-like ATPase
MAKSSGSTAAVEALKGIQPIVQTGLLERADEDRIASAALIMGEHALFVGTKGTAKSLHAEELFRRLEGRKFRAHISRNSTEDILFGPPSIEAYRKGKYAFEYQGSLLDCEFAYIEEGFDASDNMLRTMLRVLNEREFMRGSFQIKVPLRTAIMTANYTRVNEVTDAFIDRFLLKWAVEPVRAKEHLLDWTPEPKVTPITLADLDARRAAANKVDLPTEIKKLMVQISNRLKLSDRTLVRSATLLRVFANLAGRETVEWQDVYAYAYVAGWTPEFKASAINVIDEVVKELKEVVVAKQQLNDLASWSKVVSSAPLNLNGTKILNQLKATVERMVPVNEDVAAKKNTLVEELRQKFQKAQQESGVV